MKIGFVGTGILGSAIIRRLLKVYGEINVFNRNINRAMSLVPDGANICDSVVQLIDASEIIFYCLSSESAINNMLLDILENTVQSIQSKKTIVDLCTASPSYANTVSSKLKEFGINYLECPVSGGSIGAINGCLTGICAGEKDIFSEYEHILKLFCQSLYYVGDFGNAQKLKIINNLAESINLVCGAEVVNIAQTLGFDIRTIRNIFTSARGKSDYMTLLLNKICTDDKNVDVTLDVRLKDLRLAMNLIDEVNLTPILSKNTSLIFEETINIYGPMMDQSICNNVIKSIMENNNQ